jgi:hypothetical protein
MAVVPLLSLSDIVRIGRNLFAFIGHILRGQSSPAGRTLLLLLKNAPWPNLLHDIGPQVVHRLYDAVLEAAKGHWDSEIRRMGRELVDALEREWPSELKAFHDASARKPLETGIEGWRLVIGAAVKRNRDINEREMLGRVAGLVGDSIEKEYPSLNCKSVTERRKSDAAPMLHAISLPRLRVISKSDPPR